MLSKEEGMTLSCQRISGRKKYADARMGGNVNICTVAN
jgi:hypothetical protein